MFANLALSPDYNVASTFISLSEMLERCSLYFHKKIANCVMKLSNSGLQKAGEIIKIPYFLRNTDVSNKFAKFQDGQQYVFYPKTLKTKLKLNINVRRRKSRN